MMNFLTRLLFLSLFTSVCSAEVKKAAKEPPTIPKHPPASWLTYHLADHACSDSGRFLGKTADGLFENLPQRLCGLPPVSRHDASIWHGFATFTADHPRGPGKGRPRIGCP
jgi:hypothetical protein